MPKEKKGKKYVLHPPSKDDIWTCQRKSLSNMHWAKSSVLVVSLFQHQTIHFVVFSIVQCSIHIGEALLLNFAQLNTEVQYAIHLHIERGQRTGSCSRNS